MATMSRTSLTDAEKDFLRLVLIRATFQKIGQPYIATALFRLIPVSAPGLGTMAVDKFWRVYIDFEFFMEKGVEYAAGVFAHEPWHLLRDHNTRFTNLPETGQRNNPKVWNIAGDLEINDDIKSLIPAELICPAVDSFAKYKEFLTAENYWDQLMQDPETVNKFVPPKPECNCKKGAPKPDPNKKDDKQDGGKDKSDDAEKGDEGDNGEDEGDGDTGDQPGDGNGDGDSDQEGEGDGTGEGTPGQGNGTGKTDVKGDGNGEYTGDDADEDGEGDGNGKPSNQPGNGTPTATDHDPHNHDGDEKDCPVHGGKKVIGCGTGAGGDELEEYELGEEDFDSIDKDEADSIKIQVAEAARSMERSDPGSVPGYVTDWAGQVLAHKPVDWRTALRGQVKSAIAWKRGQLDYVRTRPARRQPIKGAILPALRSPKPTIMIGIDTSGSNLGKLGVIVDEIVSISKSVGVRGRDLRAFAVDVQASKAKIVNDPRKVLNDSRLGGGTNMVAGFEYAASVKPKPDFFILCTDGETPWSSTPPKGSGNMKFLTLIVIDSSLGWSNSVVENAEKTVGLWSKILVIDLGLEKDALGNKK
jgi:predicted metal-dependent peptidase